MKVELPRRALRQPSPALHPGGDCAACSFGGLVGFESVQQVYDEFSEGEPVATSWETSRRRLWEARSRGFIDRFIEDVPLWPDMFLGHLTWGNTSWFCQGLAWENYLTMAFDAGYYGLASINYKGEGPGSDTDHAVLLCGIEEVHTPLTLSTGTKASRIDRHLLVSCSSKGDYWMETRKFLQEYGGFNVLLARPVSHLG